MPDAEPNRKWFQFSLRLLLLVVVAGGVIWMVTLITLSFRHDKAFEDGLSRIPYVVDFKETFPDARHFITHYSGYYGKPIWNSEVALYGHYQLTMQIQIEFDVSRTSIKNYGDPAFVLVEVAKIGKASNGNLLIEYNGNNERRFGLTKWNEIVKNDGDLSILGINLRKNEPITGFEKIGT